MDNKISFENYGASLYPFLADIKILELIIRNECNMGTK